jgi:hypothetical protein
MPTYNYEEMGVEKSWVGQTPIVSSDATLTPDKKTGGQWGELMGKMKRGMPKRYHNNLDRASNNSGTRWKG